MRNTSETKEVIIPCLRAASSARRACASEMIPPASTAMSTAQVAAKPNLCRRNLLLMRYRVVSRRASTRSPFRWRSMSSMKASTVW